MCEVCQDPWKPYIFKQYIQFAIDFERHAELCQCPNCGTLYEVFGEERLRPRKVTVEEARTLFPVLSSDGFRLRPSRQAGIKG